MLIFDDDSENDWNRQKVLERLSQVTSAAEPAAADRHGLQSGRPDLLLHAEEHEPAVRRDGSEVARGLGAREAVQVGSERGGRGQLRRPHARVSGSRRSGQADLLRAEHRPGGAAARQQQRERRRKLHRGRACSRSTCGPSAWFKTVDDIEDTVIKTQNGTPLRVKDIAAVAQGPKIRLGRNRQSDSSRGRQDHR